VGERGPAPKDPAKRQRRNKPPEVEVLPEAPKVDAPRLPAKPGGGRWLTATRRWYKTWCESPQAAGFGQTDWARLHMLAPLVDAYWRGDLAKMGEIRQNESKLGATVADRQRLRWQLPSAHRVDEEPEGPAERTPAPTQRRRPRGGRDPRLRAV
jgi:hypothetical protein